MAFSRSFRVRVDEESLEIEFVVDKDGNRKSIGEGGYGRVYLAKVKVTEKTVAVKEVTIPPGGRQDKRKQHVEDEIDALGKVSHPNVIKYVGHHCTEKDDGALVIRIVTETALCDTLHTYLQSHRPVNTTNVKLFAVQLLDALQYIHGKKIIHCDVKPSNILVFKEYPRALVKLIDFGLAIDARKLEGGHILVGTPPYIAPEVYQKKEPTDKRDMFSLGMIMLEMMGGNIHGYKFHEELTKELEKVFTGKPKHKKFKQIIQQLLDHQPESRPSAAELLKHDVFKLADDYGDKPLPPTNDKIRFEMGDDTTSAHSFTPLRGCPWTGFDVSSHTFVRHQYLPDFAYSADDNTKHDILYVLRKSHMDSAQKDENQSLCVVKHLVYLYSTTRLSGLSVAQLIECAKLVRLQLLNEDTPTHQESQAAHYQLDNKEARTRRLDIHCSLVMTLYFNFMLSEDYNKPSKKSSTYSIRNDLLDACADAKRVYRTTDGDRIPERKAVLKAGISMVKYIEKVVKKGATKDSIEVFKLIAVFVWEKSCGETCDVGKIEDVITRLQRVQHKEDLYIMLYFLAAQNTDHYENVTRIAKELLAYRVAHKKKNSNWKIEITFMTFLVQIIFAKTPSKPIAQYMLGEHEKTLGIPLQTDKDKSMFRDNARVLCILLIFNKNQVVKRIACEEIYCFAHSISRDNFVYQKPICDLWTSSRTSETFKPLHCIECKSSVAEHITVTDQHSVWKGKFHNNEIIEIKIGSLTDKNEEKNRISNDVEVLKVLSDNDPNSQFVAELMGYETAVNPKYYVIKREDTIGLREYYENKGNTTSLDLIELCLDVVKVVRFCNERRVLLRNISSQTFSCDTYTGHVKLVLPHMAVLLGGHDVDCYGELSDQMVLSHLAPESLVRHCYSKESDCYSTMWTLLVLLTFNTNSMYVCGGESDMKQPLEEKLSHTVIPSQPTNIPMALYQLLLQGLHYDPKKRKSLQDLSRQLEKLRNKYSHVSNTGHQMYKLEEKDKFTVRYEKIPEEFSCLSSPPPPPKEELPSGQLHSVLARKELWKAAKSLKLQISNMLDRRGIDLLKLTNNPGLCSLERWDKLTVKLNQTDCQQLLIDKVSSQSTTEAEMASYYLQIVDAISHLLSKGLVLTALPCSHVFVSEGNVKLAPHRVLYRLKDPQGEDEEVFDVLPDAGDDDKWLTYFQARETTESRIVSKKSIIAPLANLMAILEWAYHLSHASQKTVSPSKNIAPFRIPFGNLTPAEVVVQQRRGTAVALPQSTSPLIKTLIPLMSLYPSYRRPDIQQVSNILITGRFDRFVGSLDQDDVFTTETKALIDKYLPTPSPDVINGALHNIQICDSNSSMPLNTSCGAHAPVLYQHAAQQGIRLIRPTANV